MFGMETKGEVRVCIHLNLCGHTPEMPEAGRYTCTPVAAHNLIDGRVTDGLALGLHFSKPPFLSTPKRVRSEQTLRCCALKASQPCPSSPTPCETRINGDGDGLNETTKGGKFGLASPL